MRGILGHNGGKKNFYDPINIANAGDCEGLSDLKKASPKCFPRKYLRLESCLRILVQWTYRPVDQLHRRARHARIRVQVWLQDGKLTELVGPESESIRRIQRE